MKIPLLAYTISQAVILPCFSHRLYQHKGQISSRILQLPMWSLMSLRPCSRGERTGFAQPQSPQCQAVTSTTLSLPGRKPFRILVWWLCPGTGKLVNRYLQSAIFQLSFSVVVSLTWSAVWMKGMWRVKAKLGADSGHTFIVLHIWF